MRFVFVSSKEKLTVESSTPQYLGRYTVSGSGADCKSVVFDSGSSTLSLPTKALWFALHRDHIKTGRVAKYERLVGSKG